MQSSLFVLFYVNKKLSIIVIIYINSRTSAKLQQRKIYTVIEVC